MFSASELLDIGAGLAREGAEFALAHGIVRYTEDGGVGHLPFALSPWLAEQSFVQETHRLTPIFNTLYHRVAQDTEFLVSELEQAVAADEFLARLLACMRDEAPGKPCFYMNRNDCMPALTEDGGVWPKQVEMNLMASALGNGSARVFDMHQFMYRDHPVSNHLVDNDAGEGLAWALHEGYRFYGGNGVVLFLVPQGEVNVFDQRQLQVRLTTEYGVPTARCTLDELGEKGRVREGRLYYGDTPVDIAYFRTGYAPRHYPSEAAWKARHLIETSSALSVPSARTQLANTKMMQLRLADEKLLKRFLDDQDAAAAAKANVAFAELDDELTWKGQTGPARELAAQFKDDWVLKPHREGGGNNYFGDEMVKKLAEIDQRTGRAYILMEKIRQDAFKAVRLVNHEVIPCECFTEMGFFGLAYYPEPKVEPTFNTARGYLLRTKDRSMDEGLVLGGFSFLDVAAIRHPTVRD